jgi:DNA-binding MarR family transcriptional regulator
MPGRRMPALDRFLTYRLHQLHKITDRASSQAYAQEFGLPVGEARCLAAIGNFAPLSLNQLAARANLDKAQASRATQRLVERGLVVKQAHPEDARGVLLVPTPRGRRLWNRVMRLIARRNEEIFGCLTRAEQRQLAAWLDRVLDNAGR